MATNEVVRVEVQCDHCLRINEYPDVSYAVEDGWSLAEDNDRDEDICEDCEIELEQSNPQEGDISTLDHKNFYEYGIGRLLFTVDEDADHKAAIAEWMKRVGFYPNAWWISDHGNAHLIDLNGYL